MATLTHALILSFVLPPGTFLIRFSTTHLGLLAISFVVAPPTSPSSAVCSPPSLPPSNMIQHCLVRVSEAGCELFLEPGRRRYNNLQVGKVGGRGEGKEGGREGGKGSSCCCAAQQQQQRSRREQARQSAERRRRRGSDIPIRRGNASPADRPADL